VRSAGVFEYIVRYFVFYYWFCCMEDNVRTWGVMGGNVIMTLGLFLAVFKGS